MTALPRNEPMRMICMLHTTVEPVATGIEKIVFPYIDIIDLRRIMRQLVLVQNGREESDRTNAVRPCVSHISRHTCAVAEACNKAGRDGIGRIYHINQITDRMFNLMLMAQTRVAEHAFP